uniref:Retrotransposon protein, putative, unclassified n=1 Tax=Oryza sativa subsp. japonica TaxID=39947 RepID=Q2QRG8_ORYSJ|nr:retrotransposon protein, putative, unclassified [Oryza sativa Japonica Group]
MVFKDYFCRHIAPLQERSRGAWEYTGYNDPMRTHVGERWDWSEEDAKTVVRRVLGLDTIEHTLIPDGILPLCSDRDRENILAVMMAVGAGGGRPRQGAVGGGGGDGAARFPPKGPQRPNPPGGRSLSDRDGQELADPGLRSLHTPQRGPRATRQIPTFPESPNLQEKTLKNSKASKASHTDPKQPFEHVDPV